MLAVFLTFSLTGGGMLLYGFVKTQALNGKQLREQSELRKKAELRDAAKRGDIYSTDGKTLATTIVVCDLYLDLGYRVVKDADNVPQKDADGHIIHDTTIKRAAFVKYLDTISQMIGDAVPTMTAAEAKRKIVNERRKAKPSQCFLIARNIPYTSWLEMRNIIGWRRGIIEQVDDHEVRHQMRVRIYDNLAGNVIGFRNGMLDYYTGLEGYYDTILRGQDGIYECRRLTRGVWLPDRPKQEKIDGGHITATIDTRYQDLADQSLRLALAERKGTSGCAILMEAKTGYVLACANLTADTMTHRFAERIDRNIACSDRLHPGSTFKPIVLAAMMNDDSITIDTNIRLRARVKNFDGTPEGELTDEHAIGDTITLAEAIIHSSNVAMADLGWAYYRRNRKHLVEQVRSVFPGDALMIDLRTPESRQVINDMRYTRDFLNLCFGYSTAVSPLQLLTFYNAIANDGRMMKPLFCRSIITERGTTTVKPVVMKEKAFDKATSRYLKSTLRRVVSEGTATSIRNNSYGIAGKTGTAKVHPTGFSANDAFFVGFFPADEPKYTCLVLIRNTFSSGGAAAAPVVRRIADGVMALDKEMGKIKMDQLEWDTPAASRVASNKKAYAAEVAEAYDRIDADFPLADSTYVWITYQDGFHNYSPRTDIMPNCNGMTIKDAMRLLNGMGMNVKFTGCGKVVSQEPRARTPIRKGNTAWLTLAF